MHDVPAATCQALAVPPASPVDATEHFTGRLAFETDPADVAADLRSHGDDLPYVLVDARSPEAHAAAHLPGATSLPWATIDADTVAAHLPAGVPVVTYCWSIHCNAATKAAVRLAALGVPVKEMIGGIDAWRAEGHPVEEPASTP